HRGVFVDQKWCDLIPCLFPHIFIDRSPGLNVAYWNLAQRLISFQDGKYYANSIPMVFFHFSGLVAEAPYILSKHENRFSNVGVPELVNQIVLEYISRLQANGLERYESLDYGFDFFDRSKIRIPYLVREIYRNTKWIQDIFGDNPFDLSRDPGLCLTYNKKPFGEKTLHTILSYEILRRDENFKTLLAQIATSGDSEWLTWLQGKTIEQYDLDKIFTEHFVGAKNKRLFSSVSLYNLIAEIFNIIRKFISVLRYIRHLKI
ncbi:MAG: hypothetical protein ACP5U1_15350, partial [Desulfomonilaceae bacterium]